MKIRRRALERERPAHYVLLRRREHLRHRRERLLDLLEQ
jgi:hypothetical protein